MKTKPTPSQEIHRIDKARMRVILNAPFFGALIMRLPMVRDDSIPTFCTNGKHIRYNEAFSAKLTDLQLRGVLVHEVAHVALGHIWRRDHRDPMRWNIACDFAVNLLLTDYANETSRGSGQKVWDLPPGGFLDPTFRDKSSEEIYRLLPEQPAALTAMLGQGKDGDGAPMPSAGEFEDAPKEGDGDSGKDGKGKDGKPETSPGSQPKQSLEDEWKIAVTQAAMVAKMKGNCPSSISRLVDGLINPKVPWGQVLREFVQARAREDYSYMRPARRYLHSGVILPGLFSERMGTIAVAVDTSGSIDEEMLAAFASEIQAIIDAVKPERLIVLYCDAKVQHVSEYAPGERIRLDEAKGGGGTAFEPVFEWIEQHGEEPECLIYLTDTYGSFPDDEPEYPVLWASYGGDDVPWGQFIKVE